MPKCNPTFRVPLGVPLPAAIWASLMSSLASGPDRIGLDVDGALWPQATPHASVSAERIAKIFFGMGIPLAVAKLWIQTDAQPVPEHIGGEHQHRDADAGEDFEPPSALHQRLSLLGHHETPRRLRRRDADAQEAQRRLDDHGDADLEAEEHHYGVHHVREQVSPHDRELTDAVDLRELHEIALTERQHLAADGARVPAPEHQREDEHYIPQARPPDARQEDREDQRWQGQPGVGDAHDDLVPPPAHVAGQDAKHGTDRAGEERAGERDDERNAGAV